VKSNKCPLKVSLVGVPQGLPLVLENNEDAVFNVLVTDYVLGQEWNFIIKVVFPHFNSQFMHLKTSVRPQESLVFVVGQMKIIHNDFYVYIRDINLIDINRLKKKIFDNSSNSSIEDVNMTRSKLLFMYQNINNNLKKAHDVEDLSSVLNDRVDEFYPGSSSTDNVSSKRVRVESCDESVDEIDSIDKCNVEFNKSDSSDEVDQDNTLSNLPKKKNFQKSKKGKEPTDGSLRSALRSFKSSTNVIN
ncbi:7248_t:CDS:1, partial [Scutellospora calospora]